MRGASDPAGESATTGQPGPAWIWHVSGTEHRDCQRRPVNSRVSGRSDAELQSQYRPPLHPPESLGYSTFRTIRVRIVSQRIVSRPVYRACDQPCRAVTVDVRALQQRGSLLSRLRRLAVAPSTSPGTCLVIFVNTCWLSVVETGCCSRAPTTPTNARTINGVQLHYPGPGKPVMKAPRSRRFPQRRQVSPLGGGPPPGRS